MTTKQTSQPPRNLDPHPQSGIRNTRVTRFSALALTAGALACALAASAALRDREPTLRDNLSPTQPLTVDVIALDQTQQFQRTRSFLGRVEPARSSEVGFELAGKLLRIEVEEGDLVRRDDVLAYLDTERLDASKRELNAGVAVASAELDLARSTRKRIMDLNGKGHASEQQLDEASERFLAAQASLKLAQARVASLRTELDKSVLRAPFGSKVVARHLDEGRVVATGVPVLTLQEQRHPQARIGVPYEVADRIDTTANYSLTIGGRTYPARARAVLPIVGARTRTVDVILDIDAQNKASGATLRAGDLAQLRVDDSVDVAGAWVPLSALAAGRRGTWVLYGVVPSTDPIDPGSFSADNGTALDVAAMTVEVLSQNKTQAYVRGVFNDGDQVITHGLNRVVPGQRVRINNVDTRAEQGRSQ